MLELESESEWWRGGREHMVGNRGGGDDAHDRRQPEELECVQGVIGDVGQEIRRDNSRSVGVIVGPVRVEVRVAWRARWVVDRAGGGGSGCNVWGNGAGGAGGT